MPSQTNNSITAGNSTRRYQADDYEYCEVLDIHHPEDNRTRALTRQLHQAARAYRQPLATLSPTAGNSVRQIATEALVATRTNATTTRAQAQQARLVIKEPKPKKFLHSIGINNQPSSHNRPPTTIPPHIPLNHLWAGETSLGRSFRFAVPSQHRHTTSLLQELSAEDLRTDKEPESREEDMADDAEDEEEQEMEEWEREG